MIATGMFAAVIAPLEFSFFKDIISELEGFGHLGFVAHSGQIFGYYFMALALVQI